MSVTVIPRILTTTDLAALVRDVAQDRSRWEPLVEYHAEKRFWVRLDPPADLRDSVDLWLLTWLPGQTTQPHDHGDSAAAFQVVRGSITELQWGADGSRTSTRLQAGRSRQVPVGAVHDVVNLASEPAVSIHAYSPRLTHMTYYRVDGYGLRAERVVESDDPDSE